MIHILLLYFLMSYSLLGHAESIALKSPSVCVQAKASPHSDIQSVSINTASFSELRRVKGLSKQKVIAMIRYRKKNGLYHTVDELKNIKTFQRLSDEKWFALKKCLTI